MAGRNDDNTAATMAGMMFAGLVIVGVFLFALFAFLAFIFTIAALIAWNEPLHIGKHTLAPHEARVFVYRGILGALVVPTFIAFASVLFDIHIVWDYWPYMVIGGYTAGSIGLEILLAEDEAPATPATMPPVAQIAPREPVQQEPFLFASWDDEEKRG